MVGRVPVAAAQRPDRARAASPTPTSQAAAAGAAGRPVQRARPARHAVSRPCRRASARTQNQMSNVLSPPTAERRLRSTACSRSASPSATRSTCSAPTAGRSNRSRRWPRRSASSSRRAYLSLASNVVAAAILEASLRAQIDATQRIIAAQRETLGILRRQAGPGRDHRRRRRRAGGGARPGRGHPAAAAEGAGPAAQPARHPDRPSAQRPAWPSASSSADLKLPQDLPLSLPSQAGRATARRARGRGQPALGERPGGRRDRQPVPADHLERRHQHARRSPSTSCSCPA